MSLKDLQTGEMNNSFLFELPNFEEHDGKLSTFEPKMIHGFDVQRIIYIYDVPKGEERANHACMNASLLFIAMSGSVSLLIECEGVVREYRLEDKNHAVYVPPASWIRVHNFTKDAVLLGLSDKQYKDCNYINDYNEFKRFIGEES